MHNNLNILEMKRVSELQPFIPKCQPAKYLTVNNLSHRLKGDYQSITLFPQPTPSCGSSCEKMTSSNAINVVKGPLGAVPPGAKAFL